MIDHRHQEQKATLKVDLTDFAEAGVGQVIGRYKLLEKVGEGGCSVVYVAEQTEPVRRRVALRVTKLGTDTKQVVARSQSAILWDIITGQELLTLAGQGSPLYDVQFSEDTLLIGPMPGYAAGAYQFWRAPSWNEIETAEGREKKEAQPQ